MGSIKFEFEKLRNDTPPSSLVDSNVSPNWKQRKSKESGHTPWLVALWGVEGRAGAPGWD